MADESPSAELYRGLFQLYKDEGAAGMVRILACSTRSWTSATTTTVPDHEQRHARAGDGSPPCARTASCAAKLVETAFTRRARHELKFDTVYFLAVLADQHRKNEEAERFYRKCLSDARTPEAKEALVYDGLLRVLGKSRKNEAIVEVCQDGLKNAKCDQSPALLQGTRPRPGESASL